MRWALQGDPGEDNLSAPASPPHTADIRCAGTGAEWAASPSHRTLGNATPAPYSSCWTGKGRGGKRRAWERFTEKRFWFKNG